jgi:hypothetical protein
MKREEHGCMMGGRLLGAFLLALLVAIAIACGHEATPPSLISGAAPTEGGLPFDRGAQDGGISPTSAVIPSGVQLPTGTTVSVRLQAPISSATARADDRFEAVLVDPVVMDGQTLLERGTTVKGRVVEAASMSTRRAAGYLRITLSQVSAHGKTVLLRTSSRLFKGAGTVRRHLPAPSGSDATLVGTLATGKGPWLDNAMTADNGSYMAITTSPKDITLGPGRPLMFHLIEPLPLQALQDPQAR